MYATRLCSVTCPNIGDTCPNIGMGSAGYDPYKVENSDHRFDKASDTTSEVERESPLPIIREAVIQLREVEGRGEPLNQGNHPCVEPADL